MFIEQPPWFFRALYPQAIFRMDPNERAVYLTFDDGPIPEVTPWVLELLEKHNIKATFFMPHNFSICNSKSISIIV